MVNSSFLNCVGLFDVEYNVEVFSLEGMVVFIVNGCYV